VLQHSTAKKGPSNAASAALLEGDFEEQKRRKRVNFSKGDRPCSVKKQEPTTEVKKLTATAASAVPTNYFAPLQAMETVEGTSTGEGTESQTPIQQQKLETKGRERPSSIILTAAVNLLKFQSQIKAITNGSCEFRNTGNGIKMVVKETADYSAIIRHLDTRKLPCYTFHLKLLKPVKAVIRYIPGDTPAEDISYEVMALGFSVISGRQMIASKPQPQGGTQLVNLPLFLVIVNRSEKSLDTFKLNHPQPRSHQG
jgi:hypothetical protein